MQLFVDSSDICKELDEILNYTNQHSERIKNINNSYVKAVELENKGEYEQSLKLHKEILEIRRKGTDKTALADSLNSIGILYMRMNDFINADKYFCEALKYRSLENDLRGFCAVHSNLSEMYYLQSLYTNDPSYLNHAIWSLDIALRHLSKKSSPKLYMSLEIRYLVLQAQMLRHSSETTPDSYRKILSGLTAFYDMIKENPQFEMQNHIMPIENNIAVILALMGDRGKALDLIKKCLTAKEPLQNTSPNPTPCTITRKNQKAIKNNKPQDLMFEF